MVYLVLLGLPLVYSGGVGINRSIGLLVTFISVLMGILLFSNVSGGVYDTDQERIVVQVKPNVRLADVVASYPGTSVENAEEGTIHIPLGDDPKMVAEHFKRNSDIDLAYAIQVEPTFYTIPYLKKVKQQLERYISGDFGGIIYKSNVTKEFPIEEQFATLVTRTMAYFIPALLMSVLLGITMALFSMIRPRIGKLLDSIHLLLISLPDFLIVFLLQFLAILLAKMAGRKVFLIMQFTDEVPFLIPFLAITVFPAALIYGALRIGLQREWEEAYIKTAYMKGLSRRMVVLSHVFRNTFEDLLAILPRAVSTAIASMVVAEVMTAIFGLGGYALNPKVISASSLPATCMVLALFALFTHFLVGVLRKKYGVYEKEGA